MASVANSHEQIMDGKKVLVQGVVLGGLQLKRKESLKPSTWKTKPPPFEGWRFSFVLASRSRDCLIPLHSDCLDGTMDASVAVAVISAGTGLVLAALSYSFNKKRERETEWRKVKLEHYREFMAALSAVVGRRSKNDKSQTRYSDAVNTMALIAPPPVLRALYDFQDEIAMSNPSHSQKNHDVRLSELFREIRRDVHPQAPDDAGITFRLMDAPPSP